MARRNTSTKNAAGTNTAAGTKYHTPQHAAGTNTAAGTKYAAGTSAHPKHQHAPQAPNTTHPSMP